MPLIGRPPGYQTRPGFATGAGAGPGLGSPPSPRTRRCARREGESELSHARLLVPSSTLGSVRLWEARAFFTRAPERPSGDRLRGARCGGGAAREAPGVRAQVSSASIFPLGSFEGRSSGGPGRAPGFREAPGGVRTARWQTIRSGGPGRPPPSAGLALWRGPPSEPGLGESAGVRCHRSALAYWSASPPWLIAPFPPAQPA